MNAMASYNDIILWEALAGDAPSMDGIVTLSYAPVHGSDDFLKPIEDEATLGRKYRSFQKVLIKEKMANVPIS